MATSPTSPVPSAADPDGHPVSPSAGREIASAIDVDGPLRFDRFMELALYGSGGFYAGGGRAGRAGADFITSPEVGPLFATVLAGVLDTWWDEFGRPDPFVVVDAGAGPGTLGRSIVAAAGRCRAALRLVAVEVSATQRARHHASVVSTALMPEAPVHVVLANELLDNLPFRLLVFDDGWREAHVVVDRNAGSNAGAAPDAAARFVEVLRPLDADAATLPWLPVTATHGARVPYQQAAAEWVRAARLLVAGRIVAFDYVTPRTAALAIDPWRHWLRTYRQHDRGGHYLAGPGAQDITAQVALDQLPEPDAVRSQAQFLQRWGIDELVEAGRAAWAAAAAAPTVAALQMRSRVREAEALLDPTGLGGFTVVEWEPMGSRGP